MWVNSVVFADRWEERGLKQKNGHNSKPISANIHQRAKINACHISVSLLLYSRRHISHLFTEEWRVACCNCNTKGWKRCFVLALWLNTIVSCFWKQNLLWCWDANLQKNTSLMHILFLIAFSCLLIKNCSFVCVGARSMLFRNIILRIFWGWSSFAKRDFRS